MGIQVNVVPNLVGTIVQLIATGILFFFMTKFLYKPVSKLLKDRQDYIEQGVKNSKEAEEKVQQMQAEYDKKILEAKKESSEIISKARSYGEELKDKAVSESKELAKAEYEKGKKALDNERQKAMKDMNDEIADMAMNAAEKLLREKVNSDTDKNMVKSFIKDLEESYE